MPTYFYEIWSIVMQKTNFDITILHLFSPESALSADSKPYILSLCFIVSGTFTNTNLILLFPTGRILNVGNRLSLDLLF